VSKSSTRAFRPRARLLLLLGDQLIRDVGVAVFELVKNAYDADASHCHVILECVDDPDIGRIVVSDDGTGMSFETVAEVWLEPGTDNRGTQRAAGRRSPRFHRLPLGEKGVGRFAAHKLGRRIEMVSRSAGEPEVLVTIDWDALEAHRYLDDAFVEIRTRVPEVFVGDRCGTRLEITGLREPWTRGRVRELHRAVTSITSPFGGPADFACSLRVSPQADWVAGLLDVDSVLEWAPFRFDAEIRGSMLEYDYRFTPPPGLRVDARHVHREVELATNLDKSPDGVPLRIGSVGIELAMFDRDPRMLESVVTDRRGLQDFLGTNGGVRVYRDGVRVYNYGEPDDDWLDLNGRRVNKPTARISTNLVLGVVSLELDKSDDLVEKTNREGFVENIAFQAFRKAVTEAITQAEGERFGDKEDVRLFSASRLRREPVVDDLRELRSRLVERGVDESTLRLLDQADKQFTELRDQLLTSASAGLSLTLVVHELEKAVIELQRAVERDVPDQHVRQLVVHLGELIEGIGYLARRSGQRFEASDVLLDQAAFNMDYRLRHHRIELVRMADEKFSVKCSRRLVIATLMNLIDNSIYWLDRRKRHRSMLLGSTVTEEGLSALVVADDGPGFVDPPEWVKRPFMSRRPEGMGLGLHLANEVMRQHEGRLEITDHASLGLEERWSGAVVALVFPARRVRS
jgi:signal transduction histidine kinase